MPRLKHIYIIVFLAMTCFAKAQTLKFDRYTTKHGLLSDEVYNLHQDKKGYIWLFTNYGAMKYNGKEFIPVLKNLPFTESIIYCIYENEQGRKWVANSNKKIFEIVNDSAFIVEGTQVKSEELSKNVREIHQLYVDDSLNIYAQTPFTVTKFIKNKNYQAIDMTIRAEDSCTNEILKFNKVCLNVLDIKLFKHSNNLKNFYLKFLDQTDSKKNFEVKCQGVHGIRYFKVFGEETYFSFFNKILKVNKDHSIKEIFINGEILHFTKDKNNHLWVACLGTGLYEVDEHDSIINHYLDGKTINDVLVDSNNGLWLSTDGLGIYHCLNLNELYYDDSHPLGKSVNFIKMIDNRIFVGTTDYHLHAFDRGNVTEIARRDYSLNDEPADIVMVNSVYLVAYRLHFEELEKSLNLSCVKFPASKPVFRSYKIVQYGKDSLAFMGRGYIGIMTNAFWNLHNKFELKKFTLNRKTFYGEKRNSDLLVATDKGVFCFKNDSLAQPYYLKKTENSIVTKIRIDPQHNYWFCTKGNGLFKLNSNNELIHYTISNGLPSNIINDIYFENETVFLLSTNKGLYYHNRLNFDFKYLYKVFDGEVRTALSFSNNTYVGTNNGLVILNSNIMKETNLYFNLSALFVNSKQTNESALNALSYKENTLEFKFDIISYEDKMYPIKYKLEGPTSDSGVIFSNKLSFKKLTPGTYILTASLLAKTNVRYSVFTEKFTIIPAFWQTTWFLILIILVALILLVLSVWFLFKYYKNKALKKAEAERIIAEYRLIALKAQINPHFMSNCLAAIQHLILNKKVDEANEYLAKFSFLLRQVLNLSGKSLVPLKEEIEIIELYIKLERLRFDKINVEFYIDQALDTEGVFIPPLLAQPIIENAIWHGLLPLSREKTAVLSIKMKAVSGVLNITIEDNGVGRKLKTNDIGNSRESKGIAITKQRIENLKYFNDRDIAALFYEDLIDDKGNPIGTRVVISLPDNLHT